MTIRTAPIALAAALVAAPAEAHMTGKCLKAILSYSLAISEYQADRVAGASDAQMMEGLRRTKAALDAAKGNCLWTVRDEHRASPRPPSSAK